MEERDAQLDELKLHLLCAQQKMKSKVDAKRRDEEFEVGEKVFVKFDLIARNLWQTDAMRNLLHVSVAFLKLWLV